MEANGASASWPFLRRAGPLPAPSSGGRGLFLLLPQGGGTSSSSFLRRAGPLPAPCSGGGTSSFSFLRRAEPLPAPSLGEWGRLLVFPQEGGASSCSFLSGAGPLPAPSSGGRDCKPRAQAHGSHRRAATRARVHGSPASFTTATLRPGAVGCEELCAAWGPRPSLILTWTRWREPVLG